MDDPLQSADPRQLPAAADVFSDRLPYKEHFARALAEHTYALASADVSNRDARRNVVAYFGVGGVGKTALVHQLMAWATGDQVMAADWGVHPPPVRAHAGYADLSDWKVESLLLMLRSIAARAGLETKAFDVGLCAWWTASRPGLEPPSFADPADADWPGAIRETAGTALKEVGLRFGTSWVAGLLTKKALEVKAAHERDRTIAACPVLRPVLEDLAWRRNEQAATSLGLLLDWDLLVTPVAERRPLVAFLDNYHRVQENSAGAEDLIQRLVLATPHVLWVIAGRRRVRWGDGPEGVGSYGGRDRWPGLAEGRDQEKLGHLDDADAEDYLCRVLVDEHGDPLLDDEARSVIVGAAGGLPIYLDWAVKRARSMILRREALVASAFGQPMAGLVDLVADDLSPAFRRALNAAALVQSFDAELLAAGAAIDHAAATRFLSESIVVAVPSHGAPRGQLHDVVREAVRDAPQQSEHAWTDADWKIAATRMLELLERRWATTQDADLRLEAALTAFDIASDRAVEAELGWVVETFWEHPARARVARQVMRRARQRPGTWTWSVEQLFGCWRADAEGSLPERLAGVAELPHLARDVRRRALRAQAYTERTLTRHDVAAEIWKALRDEQDGPLLRFQHGLTLAHVGRFAEARELVDQLDLEPGQRSKALRLRAEISLQHGHILESAEAVRIRRREALDQRREHNAMELLVSEARQRALLGPDALPLVDEAVALTTAQLAIGHLRSALCSRAICAAGDQDAVRRALGECADWMRRFGQDEVTVHEAIVVLFDAAVRRDPEAALEGRRMMRDSERARDSRWRRQLTWWSCAALEELTPVFPETQWLEDEGKVRDRWLALTQR